MSSAILKLPAALERPGSVINLNHRGDMQSIADWFWSKVDIRGHDECWLWTRGISGSGYGVVYQCGRSLRVHRVAFFGKIPPLGCPQSLVLHSCDNPAHLSLGTQADNMRQASNRGRISRGEQRHCARLTLEKVVLIRERYAGGETSAELATEFGVSQTNIRLAVTGRIWKHAGGPVGARKRKLTADDAVAIRQRHASGELLIAIAGDFGVSLSHVKGIVAGRRWKGAGSGSHDERKP